MTVVRYAELAPARILNLASPRYLPEIIEGWRGSLPFHNAYYDGLRLLMEHLYVDGFNAASGHYLRLEESIEAEGFRNPIIVSAGELDLPQNAKRVPPDWRGPDLIACEYLGGSRLWVAQRSRLVETIPCIVNDHTGVLHEAEALATPEEVLAKFTDRPGTFSMSERGVVLNDLPYMHLPEAERYTTGQQSKIRREIIDRIELAVWRWLDANDA